MLLALAGAFLARKRSRRRKHSSRLPFTVARLPEVAASVALPVWAVAAVMAALCVLLLFGVGRITKTVLCALLPSDSEPSSTSEAAFYPEISYDGASTVTTIPPQMAAAGGAAGFLAVVVLLRCCRRCCRWSGCCRRGAPQPATAWPAPGPLVQKPVPPTPTAAGTPSAASHPPGAAGARGAPLTEPSRLELSPSQQVRELLAWLEEVGAPVELAETTAAAALFSNRLAATQHGHAAATDMGRSHGLVVCTYEALAGVLAWQRERGGRCERWRGISATVCELFNWPQLQLRLRGVAGSGLLMKPTGEVWAVLGKTITDEARGRSEDSGPWRALAAAHPDSAVVLVCKQVRPGGSEGGPVTLLHGDKQWRLPQLTQPPKGEEWPEAAFTAALRRAASAGERR
uniref:Uncharacterized protein n=1 Tax=Alexandrium catenella TaxID=2925 RepID=A0A7S1R5M0_ALECA|mmetsp:Transcript_45285/g.121909  ORF Transcript_45285/g.121909 Transcript_45285/m.121909 type:complete len:401 (+) Transcript_45285:3-1205(+)